MIRHSPSSLIYFGLRGRCLPATLLACKLITFIVDGQDDFDQEQWTRGRGTNTIYQLPYGSIYFGERRQRSQANLLTFKVATVDVRWTGER